MALSDYMFFTINGETTSSWFDNSNYRLAIINVGGKSFWDRPYGRTENLTFDLTLTVVDARDLQPVPIVNYLETICSKLYRKDDVKLKLYNQDCHYFGQFAGGKINTNFKHQAYFDVKFTCTKPYGFLDTRIETFRHTGATEKSFSLECMTSMEDIDTTPIVVLTSKSSTNTKVYVVNKTTSEKIEFDFSKSNVNEKLGSNEIITVDCNKKEIESNADLNRYKQWNGDFMTLKPGNNNIGVYGNIEVQIKYTPSMRV